MRAISSSYLLKLERVEKRYWTGAGLVVDALKPTTLEVNQGEYIAIVGPSGSGKSTLLHLLGLLDTPTSGEIIFNGRHVSKLPERRRAQIRNRNLGFVFQLFNLLPRTPSWENVALPLVYAGVSYSQRRRRAEKILRRLGLGDRLNHHPNQLSGGEQQRVAIARALVNNPQLILADEPTGNLDTASGKSLMELFNQLNRQGKTILIVTHDPQVARHARRHLTIIDGKVRESKGEVIR